MEREDKKRRREKKMRRKEKKRVQTFTTYLVKRSSTGTFDQTRTSSDHSSESQRPPQILFKKRGERGERKRKEKAKRR